MLAIRQRAACASTLITRNIPEKKKITETKKTYAQGIRSYLCLTSRYAYLFFVVVVLAPSSVSICALYVKFLQPQAASKLHPDGCVIPAPPFGHTTTAMH